jgi:hypothetical protein
MGLWVLLAVILGLSPYSYMPLASETNPPMNWGFTSTKEGFFYSVNRSQYSGKLSDQLLKTVGRAMGAAPQELLNPPPPPPGSPPPPSFRETLGKFSQLYWRKIVANFTPLSIFALVASVAFLGGLPRLIRTWIQVMALGFLLAGFLQPAFDQAGADEAAWLLYMPYLGFSHAFFVLLAGLGSGLAIQKWAKKPIFAATAAIVLGAIITTFSFRQNLTFCSQRDHWFGWMYGRDMLADLPKDSFVFGGTDPDEPGPVFGGLLLGNGGWGPAWPWPPGHHCDAASADLQDGAHRRHDHARRHLLWRQIRGLDDLDPAQRAGRIRLCGDLS